MSNSLAIAAITATLRNLLDVELNRDVPGTRVSTQPPDKVRTTGNSSQVNLFLYHTSVNAAWRNMDVPWRTRSGETAAPPLALNLYYLITAYYGESEEGVDTSGGQQRLLGSHRLLGRAMGVLHDHPVLDPAEINANLPAADRLEHPYDQVERVRITPHGLSPDELSKVWTGSQTQYRLSAAYEVSVVLIESSRATRAPLPVLRRGPADEGVESLVGPFPALDEIRCPLDPRARAQIGDTIELVGRNLGGQHVAVRFSHPLLTHVQELTPEPDSTDTQLRVKLPEPDSPGAPTDWATGFYTVVVAVQAQPDETERTTEGLPLALAPRLQAIDPNPAQRDANGRVRLTFTVSPQVLPQQRIALLLGGREIVGKPPAAATNTLTFEIANADPGDHVARLRVAAVDSLPVVQTRAGLAFDPAQKVRIV
jgi:hypothetical protein